MQPDVVRERAEERNSFSNEHRNSSDYEALDQAGAQEASNCDPAVDVDVLGASTSKACNDLGRGAGHLLDVASAHWRQIEGPAAPTRRSAGQ